MTDTPTGLTAVRTAFKELRLSWNAQANNTPPVAGYEVFYTMSGSGITQSAGTTSVNNFTLPSDVPVGSVYDFFVVAYSNMANTLPSSRSNVVTQDYS